AICVAFYVALCVSAGVADDVARDELLQKTLCLVFRPIPAPRQEAHAERKFASVERRHAQFPPGGGADEPQPCFAFGESLGCEILVHPDRTRDRKNAARFHGRFLPALTLSTSLLVTRDSHA